MTTKSEVEKFGNRLTEFVPIYMPNGIEPHVPVWGKAETKDATFSRSDFRYDAVNDEYRCLTGQRLKQYWTRGWQSRSARAKTPSYQQTRR